MSLARRLDAIEQQLGTMAASDADVPEWAVPLQYLADVEHKADAIYMVLEALERALDEGWCYVAHPHQLRARRLMVDMCRPGATLELRAAFQRWYDAINALFDINRFPLEEKPQTLEGYAALIQQRRPVMAYSQALSDEERALVRDAGDDPLLWPAERQALEDRYIAWLIEKGCEL